MFAFGTLSTFVITLAAVLQVAADGTHKNARRRHAGISSLEPEPEPVRNSTLVKRGQTFDNARFTMYYQKGNPGYCGQYHSDNDWVSCTCNL